MRRILRTGMRHFLFAARGLSGGTAMEHFSSAPRPDSRFKTALGDLFDDGAHQSEPSENRAQETKRLAWRWPRFRLRASRFFRTDRH